MTVQECAEALGVDTLQVFVRAKNMYPYHGGSPTDDHRRWVRDGKGKGVPYYVLAYLNYRSTIMHRLNGS